MPNEYYLWLLSKIRADLHTNYSMLLAKLNSTQYRMTRDVDQPRVRKVAELKQEFCDECFINYPVSNDIPNVSVLEVLVSIALDTERMVMRDGDMGDRTELWFWSMIHNLGLEEYTNDRYNEVMVNALLDRFVNHTYLKNGIGSVGYTMKSRGDFRKLDIWHQFNIWLSENYVCTNTP